MKFQISDVGHGLCAFDERYFESVRFLQDVVDLLGHLASMLVPHEVQSALGVTELAPDAGFVPSGGSKLRVDQLRSCQLR